ncbi:hypothetical protein K2173_007880 [Erythroxylum novogranatense]|uniref:BHLH domain-containing protein n=1 Tax=Erythroxylum novogranatense TaxID=1862640 RepID=A0AAV8T6N3_9ROSI|nr:hypothetical protein K2173_007880 [Erythroxylum novogranatense]
MLPGQRYLFSASESQRKAGCVQESSSVDAMNDRESTLSSALQSGKKSMEALRGHKEAERRRRQRINTHLSTLRTLLPKTTKTDKASLLAEVVRHLTELRKQVADLAGKGGGGWDSDHRWPFPGDSDEATVSYCDSETRMVRASVCCEDRPGLNGDLAQAIGWARGRAVRAEMSTVGGRTKSVVVIEWVGGGGGDEDVKVLSKGLKAVVENRFSGFGLDQAVYGSKRARLLGWVST